MSVVRPISETIVQNSERSIDLEDLLAYIFEGVPIEVVDDTAAEDNLLADGVWSTVASVGEAKVGSTVTD